MPTIFCVSNALTVDSSSASGSGTVPANTISDEPGLVWRSSNLTTPYIIFRTNGAQWDTVTFLSNLRTTDTYRVRTGSTAAIASGTSPTYDSGNIAAWTGSAPPASRSSITLLQTPSVRTDLYVRIDFTATSHPDTFVQIPKVVIGKKVTNAGVDIGAEQGVRDTSIITDGPGYTLRERYTRRVTWRVTVSDIKALDHYTNWWPFLVDVGTSKGFMFIPDTDPTYMQDEAVFGFMSADPKVVAKSSDFYVIDMSIISAN